MKKITWIAVFVMLLLVPGAFAAKYSSVIYINVSNMNVIKSATLFVNGSDVDVDIGDDGIDFTKITRATINFTAQAMSYLAKNQKAKYLPMRVFGNGVVKLDGIRIKQKMPKFYNTIYIKIAKNVKVDSAMVYIDGKNVDVDVGEDGQDFTGVTNSTINFTKQANDYISRQTNITTYIPVRVYGNSVVKLKNLDIKQKIKDVVIDRSTALIDLNDYFFGNKNLSFTASKSDGLDVQIFNGIVMLRPAPGFIGPQKLYLTASDGRLFSNSNNFTVTVISAEDINDNYVNYKGQNIIPDKVFKINFKSNITIDMKNIVKEMLHVRDQKKILDYNFDPSAYKINVNGSLDFRIINGSVLTVKSNANQKQYLVIEIVMPSSRKFELAYANNQKGNDRRFNSSYIIEVQSVQPANVRKIKGNTKIAFSSQIDNRDGRGPASFDADLEVPLSLEKEADDVLNDFENVSLSAGAKDIASKQKKLKKSMQALVKKSNGKVNASIRLGGKNLVVDNLKVDNNTISLPYRELQDRQFYSGKTKISDVFAMDPSNLSYSNGTMQIFASGKAIYKCKDWDFGADSCLGSWTKLMDTVPGKWYTISIYKEDPAFGQAGVILFDDMEIGGYADQGKWIGAGTAPVLFAKDRSVSYSGLYSYSDSRPQWQLAYVSAGPKQWNVTSPRFNLTGYTKANASWYWVHDVEIGGGICWDVIVIEVSSNNGATYTNLKTNLDPNGNMDLSGASSNRRYPDARFYSTCGYQGNWAKEWVNLTSAANKENVTVRFSLSIDAAAGGAGFAFDDFLVQGTEFKSPVPTNPKFNPWKINITKSTILNATIRDNTQYVGFASADVKFRNGTKKTYNFANQTYKGSITSYNRIPAVQQIIGTNITTIYADGCTNLFNYTQSPENDWTIVGGWCHAVSCNPTYYTSWNSFNTSYFKGIWYSMQYRDVAADNLGANECIYTQVYNGTSWGQNLTVQCNDFGAGPKNVNFTLGKSNMSDSFKLRFTCTNAANYMEIDNIKVKGFKAPNFNQTGYIYPSVNNSLFYNISSIKVKVEVAGYNPNASVKAGNSKPDLYLSLYNGNVWVDIGSFSLPSVYAGSGTQGTHNNFSIVTANSQILPNWLDPQHRNVRISGINFDQPNTLTRDKINISELYVTINGSRVNNVFFVNISNLLSVGPNNLTNITSRDLFGNRNETNYSTSYPTQVNLTVFGFAKVVIAPKPGGVANFGDHSNITCLVTDNTTGVAVAGFNATIYSNKTGAVVKVGSGLTDANGNYTKINEVINKQINYSCKLLVNMTSKYYYRSRTKGQNISWQIVSKDTIPPQWGKWNISKNNVNITNGVKINRTDTVKAFALWTDNIQLKSAYIQHNSTGAMVNYSITPFPATPTRGWSNDTFNFANGNEWKVGKVNVSKISVLDGANNLNKTRPSKWFSLYGIINLTRMSLPSSAIVGYQSPVSCRVRDYGNISVSGYTVSFSNNETGNLGTAITNLTGWAKINASLPFVGNANVSCSISDVAGDYYYVSSPLTLSKNINMLSDNVYPSLYWFTVSKGQIQSGSSTLFTINASDDSGTVFADVNITYPNGFSNRYSATKIGNLFYYTFANTSLDGVYNYQITARDTYNNKNKSIIGSLEVIGRRASISLQTNQTNFKAGFGTGYRNGKNVTLNNYLSWTSPDQESGMRYSNVTGDLDNAVYYYTESDAESTIATTGVWTSKVSTTPTMVDGDYFVMATANLRSTDASNAHKARLIVDGNVVGMVAGVADETTAADYQTEFETHSTMHFNAGVHSFGIEYYADGGTVGIQDARIIAIQLPKDNFYTTSYNSTDTQKGTTYRNITTKSFTIRNGGYYLFIGTAEDTVNATAGAAAYRVISEVDGIKERPMIKYITNSFEKRDVGFMQVKYLNPGTHTMAMSHSTNNAIYASFITNTRISAFRLSDYFVFRNVNRTANFTTASTTDVAALENNFSVSSNSDYLMLLYSMHGGDATNAAANNHYVGANMDGTQNTLGVYGAITNVQDRLTFLTLKSINLNSGSHNFSMTMRRGASSAPNPSTTPAAVLVVRLKKGPAWYTNLNQSYVNYTSVSGNNYTKISDLKLIVQVDNYNSTGSNFSKNAAPDLQVRLWDGSSYNSFNFTCGLFSYYFYDKNIHYNCTRTLVNPSILRLWNKTNNRKLQVRAINVDVGGGNYKDLINWSKVIVRISTPSKAENFANWSMNDTLLMQVQRYNSTTKVWTFESTNINQSLEYNASQIRNLTAFWSLSPWKPTYNTSIAWYRVYSSIMNASKQVRVAFNSYALNDTANFTVRYLKITPFRPQNITYGNTTAINTSIFVNNTYVTQQNCVYTLDSAANQTMTFKAGIKLYWKRTGTLSLGQHNIRFYCNDTTGWTTTEKKIFFVMTDGWLPHVNITRPQNGTRFNVSATVNITANVTDNRSGVDEVWVNITGPQNYYNAFKMLGTGAKYEYNFTNTIIAGRYNFTIFANDTYKNINKTEKGYFKVNSMANITSILLSQNPVTQGENTTIRCKVQDRFNGTVLRGYNVTFNSNRTGYLGWARTNSTGWSSFNFSSVKITLEPLTCNITDNNTYSAFAKTKEINATIVQFKVNITKNILYAGANNKYTVRINVTNYGLAPVTNRMVIEVVQKNFNFSLSNPQGTWNSNMPFGYFQGGQLFKWKIASLASHASYEVNYTLTQNGTLAKLTRDFVAGLGKY